MSEATMRRPARLLGWPEVQRMVSASRSTIWRWEREGRFPRRRQIGPSRVGWLEHEVREFIESCPPARETGREDVTAEADDADAEAG